MDVDELALGIDRNLPVLKRVRPTAQNYKDIGIDPGGSDFADRMYELILSARSIHFDVSGMVQLGGANGVLLGPEALNPLGSANWELRTIWDDNTLKSKTTFWTNGKRIEIADLMQIL